MSVAGALIVAQLYLGIVFQKRPQKFTFQDLLESNKGDETRPIPYIRGKWKTKPQRIWLGDFSARAVERDSVWTDYVFFGPAFAAILDTITVSYRYYVGQGFALTWGPINRVHQVYVEDLPCAVSPIVDNAGGTLLLDDPQLFGGDQPPGQGGIYAVCDVIAGNYTQGRNAYLQSIEGNIPALRGIAALIIRGRSGFTESGYFSAGQLNLREWQVELMAWPDLLATGKARLADDSFNRVTAMYEWATNADFGAEYPTSQIHLPSWREAEATVFTDGLGFSGEINTGGNVGEVFDQLRASVDAEVYEHPRDGLKIKLIRKDYSIPALPVLSQSNTDNIEEYTPGDYADTFNRVTLDFVNAANNYQPATAVYEDPANRTLQRRAALKTIQYPGVASSALAQKLVTRDGRALAQPFPPLITNSGEKGRQLWPGDVYKFTWSDPLVEKIFRVHTRTPGVSYEGDSTFRHTATEDQYSIGLSVFGTPGVTGATNPADVWDTAPPSASWDDAAIPPNGLRMDITIGLSAELNSFITGAIEFGSYAGGQYARIYVTPPGGTQTLTPIRLSPDTNNKAQFVWPALITGTYEFCVQTFAIVSDATNGVKVCETTLASSFSVSPSASLSPSASESPSISPSASVSPSASQSPSASESPSISPSSSESGSVSPSSSISPSSSESPSVSPSSSASASISPSASLSPSSSASPSGFSGPELLSGLELWLKADAIIGIADDGDITTNWPDSSGNGRNATAVQGASDWPRYRSTAGPNSMPAVKMYAAAGLSVDAAGWFTLPNFMTGFTAGNVFVVMQKITKTSVVPGRSGPPIGDWGSNTDEYFVFSTDQKIYDSTGSSVRKTTADPGDITTNAFVYEVQTASGAWSNYKDGTQLFTTATNTVAFGSAPKVARSTTNTKKYDGYISEIIFYSRVLDDATERKAVIHAYLNDKYGFSLPEV